MAIDIRFPIATALVALLSTGCGPSIQADLSPDGRTLAETGPNGLSLRSTDGGPAQRIMNGATGQPRFSPDGRTIAVERAKGKGMETVLVDPKTKAAKPLAGDLRGPFAWRPDGSELLTWKGPVAEIYHLGSGTVVRQVRLPEAPTRAQWLPEGRDFAAASDHAMMIVHKGAVRRLDTKDTILALGFDAERDWVIWTEARQVREETFRLNAFAIPRTGGERVALLKDADTATMLKSPSPYAMPVALSVSPDGERLAIAAIVEPAPVGAWKRYIDLQKRLRARPNDKALRAELNRQEKALRYDLAVATTGISGGPVTTLTYHRNLREFQDAPESLHWSLNGERLALVTRKRVEVLEAN
ncbi:MAG: TolB family protein [Fimbriimonas sp.]